MQVQSLYLHVIQQSAVGIVTTGVEPRFEACHAAHACQNLACSGGGSLPTIPSILHICLRVRSHNVLPLPSKRKAQRLILCK